MRNAIGCATRSTVASSAGSVTSKSHNWAADQTGGWDVQRVNMLGEVRGYTSHADKLLRISDRFDDIHAAASCCTCSPSDAARPGQRLHHHRAVGGQPGPPRHCADSGPRHRLRPGRSARPWPPGRPPLGTSQAPQPPPPAASPTPRRSPQWSAAPAATGRGAQRQRRDRPWHQHGRND